MGTAVRCGVRGAGVAVSSAKSLRKRLGKTVTAAVKVLDAVMAGERTDEQIRQDAQLPQGEAPLYLHIATKLGVSAIGALKQDDPGARAGALAVVIIGQAESKEAWLEQAAGFQARALEARRTDAIEATATAEKKADVR